MIVVHVFIKILTPVFANVLEVCQTNALLHSFVCFIYQNELVRGLKF